MDPQQLSDTQGTEPRTATLDSQLTASMELPRTEPLFSPPAPVGEPDVPDPFLKEPVDSEDESVSAEEGISPFATPAVEEVTLAPTEPVTPSLPRSPNINKSVPPTPLPQASDDDDEDEDEAPEFYLPGLTLPTMFLPIPNVRYPVST